MTFELDRDFEQSLDGDAPGDHCVVCVNVGEERTIFLGEVASVYKRETNRHHAQSL